MTAGRFRAAILTAALGTAVLAAGCGAGAGTSTADTDAGTGLSLATSYAAQTGTWAVILLGGSAAAHNDFWQLLSRPAGSTKWRLATPPGVASNGGIVASPSGSSSAVVAFRPSQGLVFTPLARTADAGAKWSSGILDARIARAPDTLAADPGTRTLLALLADGTARMSDDGGSRWATIATARSLSGTPGGRHCGVRGLTGVAFGPAGQPLLAATCAHSGVAGIFMLHDGKWQLAGPALPAQLARRKVTVLAMATLPGHAQVLLVSASGPAIAVVAELPRPAAAGSGSAANWSLSQPVTFPGRQVVSASVGANGATGLVLTGRRGLILTALTAAWRRLPALPSLTQTLAVGPGSQVQAIAATRTIAKVWVSDQQDSSWVMAQRMKVPVQFGSSG